jgi:hypothetical protein
MAGKNRGGPVAGDEREGFEAAAESFTAPPPLPVEAGTGSDAEVSDNVAAVAEAMREGETGGDAVDRFEVSLEVAASAVKLPFELFAMKHPAWSLTDGEAEKVAPKMQVVLQKLADRYLPALLAKAASEHRDLLELIAALGWLVYAKGKQVSAIEAAEDAAKKTADEVAISAGATDAPGVKVCRLCGYQVAEGGDLVGHDCAAAA